jgi:hypothetical protein
MVAPVRTAIHQSDRQSSNAVVVVNVRLSQRRSVHRRRPVRRVRLGVRHGQCARAVRRDCVHL